MGINSVTNEAARWDDLQGASMQMKAPASNYPEPRMWNHGIAGGVEFPVEGFAVGEYKFGIYQTSHAMELMSVLENHFHYTLPTAPVAGDTIKFQVDVIYANVNGQWAVLPSSPFTIEIEVDALTEEHHLINDLGEFDPVNSDVSTLYKVKFQRVASTQEYSSEVYVDFNDAHYKKDGNGSRQEYSK